MKVFKNILILSFILVSVAACNKGIDPITYVAPGSDESAPVVTIKYPAEGTKIQVPELVTSINIQIEVTDDIELGSISILMDGTEITSYNEFKDYRRAVKEYLYDNVTNGSHILAVKATDLQGKTTTSQVHFEKKPPYVPLYDGEVFYMPFDGDYMEKISYVNATIVGTPGFAGEALKGSNAYKGAADSYLTFPTTGFGGEFSAAFWYKVDASPLNAGILNASLTGENRQKGFRLFREGNATSQQIKLNVGTGAAETWIDGVFIPVTGTEWIHIAFTVSSTKCSIYFDGALVKETTSAGPMDWTGCNVISIGSGAPNFTYWGHASDLSKYDELRLFNKALTQVEIQNIIDNDKPYVAKYSGEVFYMPFEGKYKDLISNTEATKVGTSAFAAGKVGQAYAGATDSYLTFPTTGLKSGAFSATFWYKVNATPDRSGILNASPTGEDRTKGFRLFREGNAASQTIKLNVGVGTETWNNGGVIAAPGTDWVHMAFTVSSTTCTIYINGVVLQEVANTGSIDWTGCDVIGIGSGAPNFTYWGHSYDVSQYDELRFFNKALTLAEVQTIMNDDN